MYRTFLSAAFIAALTVLSIASAMADALHGYCGGAGQCIDNGTNSPTSTNPPSNFGFTVSPGPATGNFGIDILIPSNENAGVTPFGITGALTGTASLFSTTPWTSGQLDIYLGLSASPANPIGAYLPSTEGFDAGAAGFDVYQADLGTTTLQGASNPNVSPLLSLTEDPPLGSYIVGFLNEDTAGQPDWVATANSDAIFENSPAGDAPPLPEPNTLTLVTTALVSLWLGVRVRQSL